MSIHRIKWYNDVIFVVSDGCIVELPKPFLIDMIHIEMMKRKDWVVWRRRYIPHGSTHDYVNLVISKGVDIRQTITGLSTDVAFQDTFRIAAWLFAIGWQVKSFKPEGKLKLTSSLVGNVIVYLCFLTFSSFSFSVRDLASKTGFLFVAWTHIFVGKWVCSLVQMTYHLSKYLPFTVPPAWFVTPRSSSEQIAGSHCVSCFPKKA